jgi:exodeoxyribonuclease VII small subunit
MSKKTTTAQELTYTQAMQKLEEITARMQDPNCDIDLLRDYTTEALSLLKFCKTRLTQTDEELKKLLTEMGDE